MKSDRGPQARDPAARLTPESLLARNVAWSFLGQVLPLIVGLAAIPALISRLGLERFGIVTLAWAIVGYFSVFDFGLGRALTKLVAERHAHSVEISHLGPLIWTALVMMGALGVVAGAVLSAVAPWISEVLGVPNQLKAETTVSIYVMAGCLPFIVLTAGLRGALEGCNRFGPVNVIRVAVGLAMFIAPLLVTVETTNLVAVIGSLAVVRLVSAGAHLWVCAGQFPGFLATRGWRREDVRPLANVGGWMTVSNIVGPLMVYCDRFLIVAALSVASVAYYVTPYEVITKLWIIPSAIATVLFPSFAASRGTDRSSTFYGAVRIILCVMAPVVLVIVTTADAAMSLWLGPGFALESARVLQWLAMGVLINSLGYIPFAFVQANGKAKWTAALHLGEVVIYVPVLWIMTKSYGVAGAAAAWTARAAVDTVILLAMAVILDPNVGRAAKTLGLTVALLLPMVYAGASVSRETAPYLAAILPLGFLFVFWRIALSGEERARALALVLSAPVRDKG